MITIITKGNSKDKKEYIFRCRSCNCLFKADSDDYIIDRSSVEFVGELVTCRCPECNDLGFKRPSYSETIYTEEDK